MDASLLSGHQTKTENSRKEQIERKRNEEGEMADGAEKARAKEEKSQADTLGD